MKATLDELTVSNVYMVGVGDFVLREGSQLCVCSFVVGLTSRMTNGLISVRLGKGAFPSLRWNSRIDLNSGRSMSSARKH